MAFELKNKVALVSGGASGIGFAYVKELIKNGLKGVTIADISEEHGKKALQEIETLFGSKKAIFVLTDVSNRESFENAFQKTVDTFQNFDILINNADIFDDFCWEKEVAVNVNGTIHGSLLALETFIPKYKSGAEGTIVNISSVLGLQCQAAVPIYSATKFAVVGMSKAFGSKEHYERTRVKVLTLCPGATKTAILENPKKSLGPEYQKMVDLSMKKIPPLQKPESVALALVQMIKNAKSGTVWVAHDDQEPYEYVHAPWYKLDSK